MLKVQKQKEIVERELRELEKAQRRQEESKSYLEEDEKNRRERLLQRHEDQLRNKVSLVDNALIMLYV